jgi:CheY-like chemotaxis protein
MLVVDDDEANLDIAKMRLGSQRYDVVTAADAEEALAHVGETIPDLVLLEPVHQAVGLR